MIMYEVYTSVSETKMAYLMIQKFVQRHEICHIYGNGSMIRFYETGYLLLQNHLSYSTIS